jgi:hypothetical protein
MFPYSVVPGHPLHMAPVHNGPHRGPRMAQVAILEEGVEYFTL